MKNLQVGDLVVALVEISEAHPASNELKLLHARPGSIGQVIALRPGHWPTVLWEHVPGLQTVSDCIPEEEFDLIRGFDITFGAPKHA